MGACFDKHVRMLAGNFHDANTTLTVSKLIQEICICLTKVFHHFSNNLLYNFDQSEIRCIANSHAQ